MELVENALIFLSSLITSTLYKENLSRHLKVTFPVNVGLTLKKTGEINLRRDNTSKCICYLQVALYIYFIRDGL